jgi:flavodoxin
MGSNAVRSLAIAIATCVLPHSSSAQQPAANAQPLFAGKNVLIVFLSRTNNTKTIAEFIQQRIGGTIVAVELEKPYRADYEATVQQVARENDTGYMPPLKTKIDRIQEYDVVFLGFPTWGMQLPPPMKSFIRQHNLRGKTVVPFNTNAGYGAGSTFQTVRELCGQCTVLGGFSTRGGVERDGQLLMIQGARAAEVRRELESWLQKTHATVARSVAPR